MMTVCGYSPLFNIMCRVVSYIFAGLTINFFSTDLDIGEGEKMVEVEMTIREAQIPFTLKLTPTTVDGALADTTFNVIDFLSNIEDIGFEAKATPGILCMDMYENKMKRI